MKKTKLPPRTATLNKQIADVARALGRRGGTAGTGKAKARTTAQARKAVNERWRRYRERQKERP